MMWAFDIFEEFDLDGPTPEPNARSLFLPTRLIAHPCQFDSWTVNWGLLICSIDPCSQSGRCATGDGEITREEWDLASKNLRNQLERSAFFHSNSTLSFRESVKTGLSRPRRRMQLENLATFFLFSHLSRCHLHLLLADETRWHAPVKSHVVLFCPWRVVCSDTNAARGVVVEFNFDEYDIIEKDGAISTKELVTKLLTQWERYILCIYELVNWFICAFRIWVLSRLSVRLWVVCMTQCHDRIYEAVFKDADDFFSDDSPMHNSWEGFGSPTSSRWGRTLPLGQRRCRVPLGHPNKDRWNFVCIASLLKFRQYSWTKHLSFYSLSDSDNTFFFF